VVSVGVCVAVDVNVSVGVCDAVGRRTDNPGALGIWQASRRRTATIKRTGLRRDVVIEVFSL
jgi:hypothetical protein